MCHEHRTGYECNKLRSVSTSHFSALASTPVAVAADDNKHGVLDHSGNGDKSGKRGG